MHPAVVSLQSHPTWVRGLKLFRLLLCSSIPHVAPYVGAWIETLCKYLDARNIRSHPTWVRGLKHHKETGKAWADLVAPYVGAWIETG